MRPILFVLGLTLLGIAVFLGFGQMHQQSASLAQPAHPAPRQDHPSGPATRQLEQILTAAQSNTGSPDEGSPDPTQAPQTAPRITLAPKGQPKGARFVKPPGAD
ncbi:MAG: hypothetical protein ACK4HF_03410 [Paracoccaceae bacterium]